MFHYNTKKFTVAILVWLNYKNAYEYWNEQRQVIDNEMKDAMPAQGYADKLPNNTATTNTSSLFLQLKVTDLGICLPMVASGANVMVSLYIIIFSLCEE